VTRAQTARSDCNTLDRRRSASEGGYVTIEYPIDFDPDEPTDD
jgi:hypothetical protein